MSGYRKREIICIPFKIDLFLKILTLLFCRRTRRAGCRTLNWHNAASTQQNYDRWTLADILNHRRDARLLSRSFHLDMRVWVHIRTTSAPCRRGCKMAKLGGAICTCKYCLRCAQRFVAGTDCAVGSSFAVLFGSYACDVLLILMIYQLSVIKEVRTSAIAQRSPFFAASENLCVC